MGENKLEEGLVLDWLCVINVSSKFHGGGISINLTKFSKHIGMPGH